MNKARRLYSKIVPIGAGLGAVSCTVMIIASIVGLLGVTGVSVSLVLPRSFNAFLDLTAQPLLIGSLVLISFSMARSGRTPFALSIIGGLLTYTGMFIVPSPVTVGGSVHAVHTSVSSANFISFIVFWIGVGLLVASMALAHGRRILVARVK